jgi:arsenite-transporting ATPase
LPFTAFYYILFLNSFANRGDMTASLSTLSKGDHKLIMIGGKGGVGKTTCAAAVAIHFSELGRKTLVISSDPTPSLSDIFETSIGDRETAIRGVGGLYGIEISSDVVLEMWRRRFGAEIHEVISSFANLDYDFVDYIGTAPGIEEEYMLNYILDLVEGGQYDLVVWDTAPAGHTMRLLHLPHIFLKHLEAATKFYLNIYSYLEKVKDSVRLRKGKRSLLEIISSWENLAEKIVRFIRDATRTAFVLVTIPEALGVKQTERIIRDFDEYQLTVGYLIINHLIEHADCSFHEIKQKMQQTYVSLLQETYANRIQLVYVPESPLEIKGIDRIREISQILFEPKR